MRRLECDYPVTLPGLVTPLYDSHSSLPRITTSGRPRSAPPKPKVHLRNYIFILRPQLTGHQLQLYQRQHACVRSKPSSSLTLPSSCASDPTAGWRRRLVRDMPLWSLKCLAGPGCPPQPGRKQPARAYPWCLRWAVYKIRSPAVMVTPRLKPQPYNPRRPH